MRLDRRIDVFFRLVQLAGRHAQVPEEATRMSMRVHLQLTGVSGGDIALYFDRGRLTVAREVPRPPTAGGDDARHHFYDLLAGRTDFNTAQLTGKVRVEGEALASGVPGHRRWSAPRPTQRRAPNASANDSWSKEPAHEVLDLLRDADLRADARAKEAQTFHDCVEQAVLADELGYHCVWEVEHHGLYEYSHSSAPEIFLAFVAARTKRIRLGHGVTLLPHRYNHPIRIAERIATLDILSGGRVNWGSGKSSSLVEQLAFENDIATLHEQWLEALEMIPRMWSTDVFAHKGKFFDMPPTQILPKPVQQPHPPMFAACTKPESAVAVGKLGLGALNFAPLVPLRQFRPL